jgi:hypothetical protein
MQTIKLLIKAGTPSDCYASTDHQSLRAAVDLQGVIINYLSTLVMSY